MNPGPGPACIAFEGDRRIASGDLREVARAAKQTLDRRKEASIVVFDGTTSATIEIDFRGSVADVLARLPANAIAAPPAEDAVVSAPRGPGRPKLGVVAREVTLLPRHWEWLAGQPGGASVAIRKLVEAARRVRRRQGSHPPGAGRRLSFHVGRMAGNRPALRGRHPRLVRRRQRRLRRTDRRLARRHPRPHRRCSRRGLPSPAASGRVRLILPVRTVTVEMTKII